MTVTCCSSMKEAEKEGDLSQGLQAKHREQSETLSQSKKCLCIGEK